MNILAFNICQNDCLVISFDSIILSLCVSMYFCIKEAIPFGPFLGFGAFLVSTFGVEIAHYIFG